jgi:hypothetical protein
MESLKEINYRRMDVSTELRVELERKFPLGTVVAFMIMYGQKNPSTGIVVGYSYNGQLCVEHIQAKRGSRYSHRDVYFEDVLK